MQVQIKLSTLTVYVQFYTSLIVKYPLLMGALDMSDVTVDRLVSHQKLCKTIVFPI